MSEGEKQLRRSMEERERIARDLHDDIIQSIYAVGLNLEECRRAARQPGEQAERRLGVAINMLNGTIRSIRGFISGLEPKLLNGNELKTALKSVAGANRLTSTEATQLLHIAKEAISNSLRHARPSLIAVSLQPDGNDACLEIRDDGCGFDPGSPRGAGHGLRNMAARAQEIGAELKIVSAIGQGCCITVAVRQHISK
jgi:signal transduction histidine kinase